MGYGRRFTYAFSRRVAASIVMYQRYARDHVCGLSRSSGPILTSKGSGFSPVGVPYASRSKAWLTSSSSSGSSRLPRLPTTVEESVEGLDALDGFE